MVFCQFWQSQSIYEIPCFFLARARLHVAYRKIVTSLSPQKNIWKSVGTFALPKLTKGGASCL